MRLASGPHGAVKDSGRSSSAEPVAVVRPVLVVEAHEVIEGMGQSGPTGEVAAAKLHPPVLLEDGALQALDEAVGPSMPGFRAGMPDPQSLAGLIEDPVEFRTPIGQHSLHPPAGAPVVREHEALEEGGGRLGRERGQQPGQAVGARRIAGGDLPDLADALQTADVERVQTDKLPRAMRLDVARGPMPRAQELSTRPFGQQAHLPQALVLDHGQARPACRQAHPAQQSLDRAGRDPYPVLASQMGGQTSGPPRPPAQRQPDHQLLDLRRQGRRPPPPGLLPPGMHPVGAVALEPLPPAVKQGPGDPDLPAGGADIAQLVAAPYDTQPDSLYAVLQGHRSILPEWFPWQGCHSGKDRLDGPFASDSEVSTLLRLGTL